MGFDGWELDNVCAEDHLGDVDAVFVDVVEVRASRLGVCSAPHAISGVSRMTCGMFRRSSTAACLFLMRPFDGVNYYGAVVCGG